MPPALDPVVPVLLPEIDLVMIPVAPLLPGDVNSPSKKSTEIDPVLSDASPPERNDVIAPSMAAVSSEVTVAV